MADSGAAELTPTEAALLGLLTSGEQSGWDLQRAGETRAGYFWAPTKPQVYAVLPRLVERDFATSRTVVQHNRPNKQVYRITRAGRNALRAWLEQAADAPAEPDRNLLLLKVFLGKLLPEDVLIDHIRTFRADAESLKAELQQLERDAIEAGTLDLYGELTLRHGLEWARAMIRWASAAERDILAGEKQPRRSARRSGG